MGKLILLCGLFALASAKTIPVSTPVSEVTSPELPHSEPTVQTDERLNTPKEVPSPVPRQRFLPDPMMLMRPGNRFYYHVPISPETAMSEFRPEFRNKPFEGFVPYYPPPNRDNSRQGSASTDDKVTATIEASTATEVPSTSVPSTEEQSKTSESQQEPEPEMVPRMDEDGSSMIPEDRGMNPNMEEGQQQQQEEESGPNEESSPSFSVQETDESEPSMDEEPQGPNQDGRMNEEQQPEVTPQEPMLIGNEEQQQPNEEEQQPEQPSEEPQQQMDPFLNPQDPRFMNPYYEYNSYMNQYPYQSKWFDEPRPMMNYDENNGPMNNVVESEMDVMRGNFDRGFA